MFLPVLGSNSLVLDFFVFLLNLTRLSPNAAAVLIVRCGISSSSDEDVSDESLLGCCRERFLPLLRFCLCTFEVRRRSLSPWFRRYLRSLDIANCKDLGILAQSSGGMFGVLGSSIAVTSIPLQ